MPAHRLAVDVVIKGGHAVELFYGHVEYWGKLPYLLVRDPTAMLLYDEQRVYADMLRSFARLISFCISRTIFSVSILLCSGYMFANKSVCGISFSDRRDGHFPCLAV